jgi:hypothetical protein
VLTVAIDQTIERAHAGDHRPGPDVLSFSLEIELEVVPWRRRAVSAAEGTTDPL